MVRNPDLRRARLHTGFDLRPAGHAEAPNLLRRNRAPTTPCDASRATDLYAMIFGFHIVASFALALLIGGMVFFAAVVAPNVFTRLPMAHAGPFIRALFPWYYGYLAVTSGLCAAALAFDRPLDAAIIGIVALVTLWLMFGLMPAINRQSDRARAGDSGAKRSFDRGHRVSVVVNVLQLAAAVTVFVRLQL